MYPITMAIILLLGLAAFAYTAWMRLGLLLSMKGPREVRWNDLKERVKGLFTFAFGQKRLLFRDWKSGLMHAFIFWGFLAVAIGTVTLFGQGFVKDFELPLMSGFLGSAYVFVKDIFEVMVLIGVTALLFRRIFLRPKRLTLSIEADVILVAIGLLMITDLLMEANYHYTVNYFVHTIGILLFLNYLPYGKHFHIITSLPNVFLRRTTPYGALKPLNLEDEKITTFGVEKISEFNWKQALDMYSCTECGRCQDECPAFATDKKLSPKELTIKLRDHLYKNSKNIIGACHSEPKAKNPVMTGILRLTPQDDKPMAPLVPATIDPETLWDCTTCRACEEACPVFIEYVDKIVDMRRNLVLMKGEFASEAQTALRNIETNSNPWGIGFSTRGDWAKDLGVKTMAEDKNVEYLYFVGCAGSFDERAKKVSRAFVKCLKKAQVSFGILGAEEKCTGDSARRIGNEYLFQMLAKENIAIFEKYGVKKIITTCPHCYNTIKNEYPAFGGKYKVIHHTELLAELISKGKLNLTGSLHGKTLAFHDSCYLGRYNDIYDAPRKVLKALPHAHLAEPQTTRDRGRCCGAGGGRMWFEEKTGTRINHRRLKDFVDDTSATIIASSCPFCLTMLSDAVKETNNSDMETLDIAELVAENL